MAPWLLVFGAGLLLAVLTSTLASRSPLSSSAVFMAVGLLAGPLALGVVSVQSTSVELVAEVALFAILFTDGQHAPARVMTRAWREVSRVLVLGMVLTFLAISVLAHVVLGLDWLPSLVLGAVLAPTDPVFASALVGRDDVPVRVRRLLNVESGLNDGLALPAVLLLVGAAGGEPEGWSTDPWVLVGELALGVVLGAALPALVHVFLKLPAVGARPELRPLGPLAVALLLLGLCELTGANAFLAAFVGGVTVASLRPDASADFQRTGNLVSELLKGAALLAFAALIGKDLLSHVDVGVVVFAVLVLALGRPLPLLLALVRSRLTRRQRLAVAWFGPKGFASVVYGIVVVGSDMPLADEIFVAVAVTVLLSVLAHSSTDVTIAQRLHVDESSEPEASSASRG